MNPRVLAGGATWRPARRWLVPLTDFGNLLVSDLSHENPSIFDGAYLLYQTEQFWPANTVFVAVVDPGGRHSFNRFPAG
jgi:S-adenosylmethionine hydroxide adenosyltransferase-like protein